MIKKCVIPAAGLGTRMLPITKAQPKETVPVVHKPVIQYVVEEAYLSGIKEILIITGKGKRAIEDHFDRSELLNKSHYLEELEIMLRDLDIFYVRQRDPKGLGDAVRYAEAFVDDEPFALLLGDNITNPPCTRMLIDVFERYKASVIAVEEVEVSRLSHHGVIKADKVEKGVFRVEDLVEKPKVEEAPSNLAVIGRYILSPKIFEYLKKVGVGYGGEIQLTDALREMCRQDGLYAYLYLGKRYDIGNKLEWLKANVELALRDKEIGEEFKKWLKTLILNSFK
ncbi:MAG: UTP--glucose-1-phosphate uridylyltransferase [Archaeoglobus sp.]|nr:UTP--glucose-1-phosphate uridylyltransferase [Archaeoglobus sp.]